MACAACHARGTAPSGKYHFPAGYVPGADLGDDFMPASNRDGETNGQALRREFREWKKKREQGEVPSCDVGAVPGFSPRVKRVRRGPLQSVLVATEWASAMPSMRAMMRLQW